MPLNSTRGASSAKGFGFTSGGVKPVDFDYLVVAGGGAGNQGLGGGGGGGGLRSSFPGGTKVTVNSKITTITVGAGGTGLNPQSDAPQPAWRAGHGQDSSVGAFITSAGGGAMNDSGAYGPPNLSPDNASVRNGGSGAGQTHQQQAITGIGNTPPVSPSQGNPGGPGGGSFGASGGGGAGSTGNNGVTPGNPTNESGPGGSGADNSISGSPVTYAGGGGGGGYGAGGGGGGPGGGGSGGPGGGGVPGGAGGTNLGGGGGGPSPTAGTGANGGSGIIYLRVPTANAPVSLAVTPGTNTITTVGTDKLCTFTVSGTLSI
jgi:hypothetical protein